MMNDSKDTARWISWQLSIYFLPKNKKKLTNILGKCHNDTGTRISEAWVDKCVQFDGK